MSWPTIVDYSDESYEIANHDYEVYRSLKECVCKRCERSREKVQIRTEIYYNWPIVGGQIDPYTMDKQELRSDGVTTMDRALATGFKQLRESEE